MKISIIKKENIHAYIEIIDRNEIVYVVSEYDGDNNNKIHFMTSSSMSDKYIFNTDENLYQAYNYIRNRFNRSELIINIKFL